jgi:hypothetical protein
MDIKFSLEIIEEYSNIKFLENPSSGSRVVPCGRRDGQKDRHDEANSRFSQFCERTQKRDLKLIVNLWYALYLYYCNSIYWLHLWISKEQNNH